MVKVLLTGGNGFIAAHIVHILLQNGFEVVVTVRSEVKGKRVLDAYPNELVDKLSYVIVSDVAQDGAFDELVKSDPPFDFVIHSACPFHHVVKDPVKDFLDPAIRGTKGLLTAVKLYAPKVKRVVITSSFAAIVNIKQDPKVYSEKEWNPVTWEEAMDPSLAYIASKTFAEKAAWEFVENEKPAFDIATINPPWVFGPILHNLNSLEAINTSNHGFKDLIQGHMKDKIPPTVGYLWVDVRDVALAHVRAMEVPEAGGQRFFVTNGFFSYKEIANIIRDTHPQFETKLPPKDFPTDRPADLYGYDNSKSLKVLGLKYRALKVTAKDTVDSLLGIDA